MLKHLTEPVKEGLIDKLYGTAKSCYFSLQNLVGVENLADVGGLSIALYGGCAKKGSLAWLVGCGVALAPEFYQIVPKIFLRSDELSDQMRTAFFREMMVDLAGVTVAYGLGAVLRRIAQRKKRNSKVY